MPTDLARLRDSAQALARQPLQRTIDPLIGWCQRWMARETPLRAEAVAVLEASTGLSEPLIHWGLETSFGAWIGQSGDEAAAIRGLLEAEGLKGAALNGWVPMLRPGLEERWVPVPLTMQILAGNVFAAAIHQMAAGLLARTAQIIKPSAEDHAFVALLRRSLAEVDPDLAATIVLASGHPEEFSDFNVITVSGDDATVNAVRAVAPEGTVIHGFGHRLSAAYIARYHLEDPARLAVIADRLAIDVCAYEQTGCLSPQIVFLEDITPAELFPLADVLFEALQARTVQWPVSRQSDAAKASRRGFLDQARMTGTVLDDGAVALVIDSSPATRIGPGGRILTVATVGHPMGVLERLEQYQGHLGTLGVALHPAVPLKGFRQSSGLFPKIPAGSENGSGFNRIALLGTMQTPSISEKHDGRYRVRLFLKREERGAPPSPP